MKILLFTSKSACFGTQVGGAESSTKLLASELATLGNNAVYVTRVRDRSRGIEVKRISADKVRVYAVGCCDRYGRFPLVARTQEWLVGLLVSFLIKTHRIELVYCFHELNNLKLKGRALEFRYR